MKILKISAFVAASVLLASCSSDDGATTSGELTGKWYYKEYKVSGETIPYDDNEACGKDYLQFNADGTGANVDIHNCVADPAPYTYTRSGNNITITSDGISDIGKIIELSSTSLKIKRTYDFDGDGDGDSVIEIYTKS